MAFLSEFNEKYSKSITLRNELIPVGNTLKNINENCLIEEDLLRSEDYKKAKLIIDEFHKEFIDKVLNQANLNWNELADVLEESVGNDSESKDLHKQKLQSIQSNLRKNISLLFTKYSFGKKSTSKGNKEKDLTYKDIFGKELFSELLPNSRFINDDDLKIINGFAEFTSYFSGFHENRRNMYSDEEESTAISYRIVHDNFPKFLANIRIFKNWKEICPDIVNKVELNLRNEGYIKDSMSLETSFNVASFNNFLSQKGIDLFNIMIGGLPAEPNKQKITGLNEEINQACQKDKNLFETLKSKKCLKMIPLYKQILSDREKVFFIESFENDKEVISSVKEFYEYILKNEGANNLLINLIHNIFQFDLSKIFISGKNVSTLSRELFGAENWSKLRDAISKDLSTDKLFIKQMKKDDSLESVEKFISKLDYSLDYLSKVTNEDITSRISESLKNKENELLNVNLGNWPEEIKKEDEKESIKKILDSLLNIYRFAQLFSTDSFDKDLNFYVDFDKAVSEFSSVVPLYNKVRNYATKKPYSLEKFKLNFKSSQLADGWSETKIDDYLSVIFKKDRMFYLGIINKNNRPVFGKATDSKYGNFYKKMKYIQFKDFSKMLPKCAFTNQVKSHFKNSDDDFVLNDPKTFIKPLTITKEVFMLNCDPSVTVKKFQKAYKSVDEIEYRKALSLWIAFGKEFLSSYKTTSAFDISSLKSPTEYNDLSEFYNEVDNITYKIDWENIDSSYIEKLVDEGKLYLFQIYNKDFAKNATGTKNLHTLYLESLFDDLNSNLGVIKLNGQAELFFRKKSIDKTNAVVHKENSKLVNRVYIDPQSGKTNQIPDACYYEIFKYSNGRLPLSEMSEESKRYLDLAVVKDATHEIIKDKRFTVDKFFFHCPITINYKADAPYRFNDKVMDFLRNNKDINIIGLDRGERNLIYATVINQEGKILECKSFNAVSHYSASKSYDVDYHSKLEQKEKERENARRSWNTVSKIATLKEGYLSAVIHDLATLMIKHNAVIVLENLNMGFKKVRGGIAERSVYQKFEKMLIDKLNYLVFKKKKWTEPGGVLNGYQLTNAFSSFKDISSQTGFLFYVPAAYTSKIDPTTGFINAFNFGRIKNSKDQMSMFKDFDGIYYSKKEDLFKFSVDFSKQKVTNDIAIKKWDIYTFGLRITRQKNSVGKWDENKTYSPTLEMKKLLENYGIEFESEKNILPVILSKDNIDAHFWNCLFFIFKNTLQMRNSSAGTMEDYILSPVKNSKGYFFDSREAKNTPYEKLTDADANGAYHIALKGLLLLNKNNLVKDNSELKKIRVLSSKEWFQFVQKDMRTK